MNNALFTNTYVMQMHWCSLEDIYYKSLQNIYVYIHIITMLSAEQEMGSLSYHAYKLISVWAYFKMFTES
jgi:hypothetical protein